MPDKNFNPQKSITKLTQEQKQDIREIIDSLKQMDKIGIMLMKNGADLLKARQELENNARLSA